MFLGHFAVALGTKKMTPRLSLGTLFLSVTFLDLLWPIFLILGIEHVRIVPGITVVTPLDFYDYPYTHSLVIALAWSVLFGTVYYILRKEIRSSLVLGLGVLSHWVIDAVVHRPDLPLFPGGSTMVGLGLWNSLPATFIVEIFLFGISTAIYVRSTAPRDKAGTFGLWGFVAFLVIIYLLNLFGPPPPHETMIGYGGLAAWLFIPWGYWIDRHRSNVES